MGIGTGHGACPPARSLTQFQKEPCVPPKNHKREDAQRLHAHCEKASITDETIKTAGSRDALLKRSYEESGLRMNTPRVVGLLEKMKTQSRWGEKQTFALRQIARIGCIVLALTSCVGCAYLERAALRKSEAYYRATSLEKLPPKPDTEPIPFLDKVPKGSRVLGVFQFSTERGRAFAMRSIEHNARRVGADAVWLRGHGEGQFPQVHHVPAHWESLPFTRLERRRYTIPGGPGEPARVVFDTIPVTGYRQEFVPEQRWTSILHYNTVDALMLKLR